MSDELADKSRAEQLSFWMGKICIAIGDGQLPDLVIRMIDYYQREAFERGVKSVTSKKRKHNGPPRIDPRIKT